VEKKASWMPASKRTRATERKEQAADTTEALPVATATTTTTEAGTAAAARTTETGTVAATARARIKSPPPGNDDNRMHAEP
jgi:hypothetical protein